MLRALTLTVTLTWAVGACTTSPSAAPVAVSNAKPTCQTDSECPSGSCQDGACGPAPTCTDGVLNGNETSVDCGGSCPGCLAGAACKLGGDCATGVCNLASCRDPAWLLPTSGPTWTPVVTKKLATPAALAFNPQRPDELWIANRKDDSLTVASLTEGTVDRFADQELHFLEAADALSFSDNGTFATCGDTRNDYHGSEMANDFMGPVLWPGSVQDFVTIDPTDASKVHLDMMHDTPWCMGIAAAGGNTYFTFNGVKGTIDWYDFGKPHENGGSDHSDGAKKRFSGMGLKRVEGVPSHLAFDVASGLLYIADTGNGRIVRLDTGTGTKKSTLKRYPDEVKMTVETGETFDVLVGDGLVQPSGLLLHEGFLYVTDAATGILHAYTLDGLAVRELDSGLGTGVLAGLAAGPDGRLYLVDRKKNRVLRLDP